MCLSGGVTQLPGLGERLQAELDALTPASVTPRVSPGPPATVLYPEVALIAQTSTTCQR